MAERGTLSPLKQQIIAYGGALIPLTPALTYTDTRAKYICMTEGGTNFVPVGIHVQHSVNSPAHH